LVVLVFSPYQRSSQTATPRREERLFSEFF
jgi:hypothetical protein